MMSHALAKALLERRDNNVRIQVIIDDDPTGRTYRTQLVELRDNDRIIDPDINIEPVVAYDGINNVIVIKAGVVALVDPDPNGTRS